MAELLSCPFCGGEVAFGTVTYSETVVAEQDWPQDLFHFVSCPMCGVSNIGVRGFLSQVDAAVVWNTRASAQPSQDLLNSRATAAPLGTWSYRVTANGFYELWQETEAGPHYAGQVNSLPSAETICERLNELPPALALPPQGRGEPVAWRWRHTMGHRQWTYGDDKPTGPSIHLFTVEPLYAAPVRSQFG